MKGPTSPDLCGKALLVVRTDRLGDVLLSLPVFAELRERFPGSKLVLLGSPAVAPLASAHPWIDDLIVDDRSGRHRRIGGFRSLVGEIESRSFAAAIILRPTLRNALLTAAARIPIRVGTAFRAYSWFFTHRVLQHRRGSGRHESELNLGLLEPLGGAGRPRPPWVPVEPEARLQARALAGGHPYVVLHPGSGGSAGEWPPEHFAALGRTLVESHRVGVVVTGIDAEAALVERVAAGIPEARSLAGRTSLPLLAALLAEARAVVAASTGTLHLAAAVGTPVVGIYPALGDASPERWGPRGEAIAILAAEGVRAPARRAAQQGATGRGAGRGPRQPSAHLATVTPEAVLAALIPWLEPRRPGPAHSCP